MMTPNICKSFMLPVALTAVVGCSAPVSSPDAEQRAAESPTVSTSIEIDGSSTVFPLTDEVAKELEFEQGDDAPDISVAFSGTGGGFRKFCAGETDINNASRPILQGEMDLCRDNGIEYIEIPVAFDALTVVVHPDNDWADEMTVAELKTLWEPAADGEVTQWDQIRPEWPSQPINLHGADLDSGTYDYFVEAIVEDAEATRTDYTPQSDDDLIVRAVRSDPDALGYFGYAYYNENQQQLKAIAIDNGNGPVLPSDETVKDGSYQPLTRPLFIYVNADRLAENSELQEFVEYYLVNVPFLAKVVGYTSLPDETYAIVADHVENNRVGTAFEGKPPTNLTLEQLTKTEREF